MTMISFGKTVQIAAAALIIGASFAIAQDTTASAGGWRRVGDPPAQGAQSSSNDQVDPNAGNYPNANYPEGQTEQSPTASAQAPSYPQQTYPQTQQPQPNYYPLPPQQGQRYPMQPPPQQQGNYRIPAQISVPAGTYIAVRINQRLSSDHNQPGDAFSATLTKPLVANGVVIAEPGQTIAGRVAQAQKAGRVEGLSKLGVELTDLTIVDGQQIPVKTTFVSRTGNSSVGRDVGGLAAITALGAAIGAGADWGRGAAIGAGAGAAAGIIGVLVTRGQPSVIYPEQVLTFRTEQPFTVATDRAPQAFHYVQPNEYNQQAYGEGPGYGGPSGPRYYGGPSVYYSAWPAYGYPYYPSYGTGFSLFLGPGWGHGYYYGGGRGGNFGYRGFRR